MFNSFSCLRFFISGGMDVRSSQGLSIINLPNVLKLLLKVTVPVDLLQPLIDQRVHLLTCTCSITHTQTELESFHHL